MQLRREQELATGERESQRAGEFESRRKRQRQLSDPDRIELHRGRLRQGAGRNVDPISAGVRDRAAPGADHVAAHRFAAVAAHGDGLASQIEWHDARRLRGLQEESRTRSARRRAIEHEVGEEWGLLALRAVEKLQALGDREREREAARRRLGDRVVDGRDALLRRQDDLRIEGHGRREDGVERRRGQRAENLPTTGGGTANGGGSASTAA